MSEFTGEQKLRIVLESTLRNVPKSEQCEKYGISEEEFDRWNNKLITDGGIIFEDDGPVRSRTKAPKVSKMGSLSKLLLSFSLLLNVVGMGIGLWVFVEKKDEIDSTQKNEEIPSGKTLSSGTQNSSNADNLLSAEINPDPLLDLKMRERLIVEKENLARNSISAEETLSPIPLENKIIPDLNPVELAREVSLMGKSFEGKHVVYLLDVGLDQRMQEEYYIRFRKVILSLMESINSLSSDSYFNLVLYWNLREVSALGKTILRANDENKKYATEWLDSLGENELSIQENRRTWVPQELLHYKPMPGVVGPWYGMSTAVSFDPDLIFVFGAGLQSYRKSAIPKAHFSGLGIDPFSNPVIPATNGVNNEDGMVSSHIRTTAVTWFRNVEKGVGLPSDPNELEKIALRRLGLVGDLSSVFGTVEIPWGKAFENFLRHLEVYFDDLPQVHYFVTLPKDTQWPRELRSTVMEFVESTKGTFSIVP